MLPDDKPFCMCPIHQPICPAFDHHTYLSRPILVPVHDLDAPSCVRRDLRQEGHVLLEGRHVPPRQALRPMRARPHPIDVAVAGFDPDKAFYLTLSDPHSE